MFILHVYYVHSQYTLFGLLINVYSRLPQY